MKRIPTYKQIRDFVWQKYRVRIWKPCHIAYVKARHGLTKRKAHNRLSGKSVRFPCPDELIGKIEDALRHFGVKVAAPSPDGRV